MFIKFKLPALLMLFIVLAGCSHRKKVDIVIYSDCCVGCVKDNFALLNNKNISGMFNLYIDSGSHFLTQEAKKNNLNFIPMTDKKMRKKFGDYDNIVVIDKQGKAREMPTNKRINIDKLFFKE